MTLAKTPTVYKPQTAQVNKAKYLAICQIEGYMPAMQRFRVVDHERARLHTYFIPYNTKMVWFKYSGTHNRWGIRAAHDGKVRCDTVDYTLLYTDWLHFLWHGIKRYINSRSEIVNSALRQSKHGGLTLVASILRRLIDIFNMAVH